MTFRIMLKNRVGTEEVALGPHYKDLVVKMMNEALDGGKVGNNDLLHRCEQMGNPRPFPHEVAMFTIAADIEDMVVYLPFEFEDYEYPSGLFLGQWVSDSFKNRVDQQTVYLILRDYFTADELKDFDTKMLPGDQANYLLLIAHAYFDEYEEDKDGL